MGHRKNKISRGLFGKGLWRLVFFVLSASLLNTAGVAIADQANDNATINVEEKVAELIAVYGEASEKRWRRVMQVPFNKPIITVSLMELPTGEVYSEELGFRGTVAEGLAKYIEATKPIIERMGIEPVFVGGQPTVLSGDDQWDALVVTKYPSVQSFVELHLDPEYREKSIPYRKITSTKRSIMMIVQPDVPLVSQELLSLPAHQAAQP